MIAARAAVLPLDAKPTYNAEWRNYFMRPFCLVLVLAAVMAMLASMGLAQQAPTAGPYKILKTVKVGGEGGFDYIFADVKGRRLYTPRGGAKGHLAVFNLDTLARVGEIEDRKSVV